MAGSGKTRFHSPKGWLAVIRMERRSYQGMEGHWVTLFALDAQNHLREVEI